MVRLRSAIRLNEEITQVFGVKADRAFAVEQRQENARNFSWSGVQDILRGRIDRPHLKHAQCSDTISSQPFKSFCGLYSVEERVQKPFNEATGTITRK
jgi:hypothetical protein